MAETNFDLKLGLDTASGRRKTNAWTKDLLKLGKTADRVQERMDRLSLTGGLKGAGKTDKLSSSTRNLGESQERTSKKTDKLTRSTRKLKKGQDDTLLSTNRLMKGIRKILGPLALFVVGSLSAAAAANELRQGVAAAVEIEAVSRALNVAAGSAIHGGEALAFVRLEADRLGTSLGPTGRGFAQMSAAAIGTQLAGQGVRDIFSAVIEATSLLGLSAADTEGALRAINQVMSKGTVQAEELRGQLGERIPGAFQIMARALDVTTPKLNKMLELGQVLAVDALPKFAAELRKTFGTDVTTRFEHAAAGLARFQTAVFNARTVLGEAFLPALLDVTRTLADMLKENEDVIASFGEFSGDVLKPLVGGLGLLLNGVAAVTDNLVLLALAAGAVALVHLPALLTAITVRVAALNVVLLANPLVAFTVAAAALGAVLNTVLLKSIRNDEKAMAKMIDTSNDLRKAVARMRDVIKGGGIEDLATELERAEKRSRALTTEVHKITAAIANLKREGRAAQEAALQDIGFGFMDASRFDVTTVAIKQLIEERDNLNSSLQTSRRVVQQLVIEEEKAFQLALKNVDLGPKTRAERDAEAASAKALKEALAGANKELKTIRETARFMREFGLSMEEAGDAAKIKLATGVVLADDAIVQLINTIRAGREELELLALLASVKPGKLQLLPVKDPLRDFRGDPDFGGPGRLGAFTAGAETADLFNFMDEISERELADARKRRQEREKEFRRGLASRKAAVGEEIRVILEGAGRMTFAFDLLSELFSGFSGGLGELVSNLARGAGDVSNAIGNLEAVVASGGGLFDRLLAGARVGQAAGGLLGAAGISTGAGQAGGLLSAGGGTLGSFLGPLLGTTGPVGAIVGGVIGELLGGLDIFQSGGDDFITVMELQAGRFVAIADKVEGSEAFRDAGQRLGDQVAELLNSLLATLGGEITDAANIRLKTRVTDEGTAFRVLEGERTILDTTDEAAAVAATVLAALQRGAVEGLSDNVSAALRETTASTFEELQQDLNLALMVDRRLMSEGERFLADRQRLLREERNALSGLGISMQDWLDGLIKVENALNRQVEAQALQLAGVDNSLKASLEVFAALNDQADQSNALQAAYDEQAASASSVAAQEAELASTRGTSAEGFEDFRAGFREFDRRLDDTGRAMDSTGQSAVVTAGRIEVVDRALLELAEEATKARGIGDFVSQIALLTGDAELAAVAAEFQHQAQLITLRLQFEQIRALGILDAALEENIETLLSRAEAEDFVFDPEGGRGKGRRQQKAQERLREEERIAAAADMFRENVADVRAELEGTAPSLADYADRVEKLNDLWTDSGLAVDALTGGLQALAELTLRDVAAPFAESAANRGRTDAQLAFSDVAKRQQEALDTALAAAADAPGAFAAAAAAITAGVAAELADLGAGVLDTFGSPFRAIRAAGGDALRDIRFLINHLEELGVTARQVANVVSQGLFSEVLSFAEAAAQALPAGTDELALARAQRIDELATLRAQNENTLALLRLEIIELELTAAGAMTDRFRDWIASSREFHSVTVAVTSAVDELARGVKEVEVLFFRPTGPGLPAGGGPTAATPLLLSDFIHEQIERAMTELERAQDDFQHTLDEIAERSGTAAERIFSIALAEEELARTREEILDRQLADVRSLLAEIEGADPRISSEERFRQAQAEFRELGARAQAGDVEALAELAGAGAAFRDQISSFFGAGGASLAALDELAAILRSVASQGPGLDFSTFAPPQGPLVPPVAFPPASGGSSTLERQALVALVELARRFEAERATDRTVQSQRAGIAADQGEEQITLAQLSNDALEAVRLELERRQEPAGDSV